jgi:hypothetical protein
VAALQPQRKPNSYGVPVRATGGGFFVRILLVAANDSWLLGEPLEEEEGRSPWPQHQGTRSPQLGRRKQQQLLR